MATPNIENAVSKGEKAANEAINFSAALAAGDWVGAAKAAWRAFKGLFGGVSVTDQARRDKINKFFEAGAEGMQAKDATNALLSKVIAAGASWSMIGKPKTLDNWFIQILNNYTFYSNRYSVAQDSGRTLTERADAIDGCGDAVEAVFNSFNSAIAEMKAGITDPCHWCRYGANNLIDVWNGAGFATETISDSERAARKTYVNNPPSGQTGTGPGAGGGGGGGGGAGGGGGGAGGNTGLIIAGVALAAILLGGKK